MIKKEFDEASREAGFGPCADNMWHEIEDCYTASDRIERDLMVDIYWHEPGIYREIIDAKHAAIDAANALKFDYGADYTFQDIGRHIDWIRRQLGRIEMAVDAAMKRMADRLAGKCIEDFRR